MLALTVAVVGGVIDAVTVYPETEDARHVALCRACRDELWELHEEQVRKRRAEIGAINV